MNHSRNKTAPDHSDQGENEDTEADRLPKGKEAGMLMHHDEGVSAGWWMNGFGEEHEKECQNHRKYVYPERVPEGLGAKHTNECTTQMPTNQCPGLGSSCPCETEEEHSGTADRGEQERG